MDAKYGKPSLSELQLQRLRSLHEVAAGSFGLSLSAKLHTDVECFATVIEQCNYEKFLNSLEFPACLHIVQARQFDDRMILAIDSSIAHPMIDRLLGGVGDESSYVDRPLTEIEMCLTSRIARHFLADYSRAWRDGLELTLDVLQTETNPHLLRIFPADEPMMVALFDVRFCHLQGLVRFAASVRVIERMLLDWESLTTGPLPSTLAEIRVVLAETQLVANELTRLQPGDIIVTETPAASPADVYVDGEHKFLGKPGLYRGKKAVCITEATEN